MPLSNSFGTNIGSHWRLQVDWSATQNYANNTSTVTMKLYWIDRTGYGAIQSSATKSGSQTLDGTTSNFSGSGLASLSSGQKKLIDTHTKTISHNADGTKSFSLSASFNPDVFLSGVGQQGNITISDTDVLNTIPRASSLSSSASWTAPNTLTVSIDRASTSFTHELKVHVKNSSGTNVLIKTITGIGSSTTVTFNTAENTSIYNCLAQANSRDTYLELITKSGSTTIGTKTYTGTCTSANRSTTSFPSSFNIGSTISGTITRSSNSYQHTIQLIFGGQTYTLFDKNAPVNWSYNTSTIAAGTTGLYSRIPNANSLTGQIRIITFYNGVQVRTHSQSNLTMKVVNSNPTFPTTYTYRDNKTSTATLTGNNQYIIQNNSELIVEITAAARALAVNNATMVRYTAEIAGKSVSANWSNTATVTINVGTINAAANSTLSVKAIDSRGNSTTVVKTVLVVPYSAPSINSTAKRVNDFENDTTITFSSVLSRLTVNSVDKNSLTKAVYQTKLATATTYGSEVSLSATGFPILTRAPFVLNLNNENAYDIKITVQDVLGTSTLTMRVPVGKPILFLDAENDSVGIGDIPKDPNTFLIAKKTVFEGNKWASSGGENGGFLVDLKNSDIGGLNGLYFNDRADNNGEGLLFLKTGATSGSTSNADYDNLRVLDGALLLNGKPVGLSMDEILWSGGAYMHGTQTITPTRSLSQCPNGWLLMWSRFDYVNNNTQNNDWNFTLLPKRFADLTAGGSWHHLQYTGGATNVIGKYIYATNTTITGHSSNNTGTNREMVLRYVFPY